MHITIVKCSSYGDIIQALSVAEFLKRNQANLKLTWVCEQPFAPLVLNCNAIDEVLTIDTKQWRKRWCSLTTLQQLLNAFKVLRRHKSDLVIDLQGNSKSALVTAALSAPKKVGFGSRNVAERPALWVTHKRYDPPSGGNIRLDYLLLAAHALGLPEVEFQTAKDRIPPVALTPTEQLPLTFCEMIAAIRRKKRGVVLVAPFSLWPNKQLADEQLKSFIQHLESHHHLSSLLLWGSEEEKKKAVELSSATSASILPARCSISQLQQLISLADLVVGMDSLPLHLAATTRTPTYSFFGPSSAVKYAPLGECHSHLQGGCPYGVTFDKRCPRLRSCPSGACLKELSLNYLKEQFDSFWTDR